MSNNFDPMRQKKIDLILWMYILKCYECDLSRILFDGEAPTASCGGVAQVGERYVRNVQVRGSNPLISTIFSPLCNHKE